MTETHRRLAIISLYGLLLVLFGLFFSGLRAARSQAQRGVWFPPGALPVPLTTNLSTPLGVTVELTQYESDAELSRALTSIKSMGISWVRQELRWDEVEQVRGQPRWARFDRAIVAADAAGLGVVVVLNRTPEWARRPGEEQNPLAPPADLSDFARFAESAARRYASEVMAWQIWDEPNLMPHWGTEVIIDPAAYAEMLRLTARGLRSLDPDAPIVSAGFAPTSEPGGFNMSEVRFLEGLYAAGAAEFFDVVALKPFGFWTGATERAYGEAALTFDRPVLVREIMETRGDSATPVWFVEGGWAALPDGWQGAPPPWGSDGAARQASRLDAALTRTALEWPWVQLIALQHFDPDVAPDQPQVGLALVDDGGSPTPLGETIAAFGNEFYRGERGQVLRAEWESVQRPSLRRWDHALWLTLITLAMLSARLSWHTLWLPWREWGTTFRALPGGLRVALFAVVALLFHQVDHVVLSLVLYGALGVLVLWQPRLGLAGVAFALPFFLQAKTLGSRQFSMVELLLFWCVVAWAWQRLARPVFDGGSADGQKAGSFARFASLSREWRRAVAPADSLDWCVMLFVLWAALTVPLAEIFGVASREFRVVVLESGVYYALLRRQDDFELTMRWVIDGFVAGAACVAMLGLYQWAFTSDVITAEGVRRVKGPYGSPNNMALYLERTLPLALALWLVDAGRRPRWGYAIAMLLVGACLLLTFSRGAWLLGVPAAMLSVAIWGGSAIRRVVIALVLVGFLALLPFATTERISGAISLEEGTGFLRLRLWEATLSMIRDNPLVGVGLDNFLYVYDRYRLPEAWREPDLSHPHQIVLHYWVALGLPGLFFLLWQQWTFWRGYRAARRRAAPGWKRAALIGLGGSMLAALAHGMIDNSFFLVDLAFVWMMTLALGMAPSGDHTAHSISGAVTPASSALHPRPAPQG